MEELTYQLANELAARGHQVSVVVNRWPRDAPGQETLDAVPVRRLDFASPRRDLRSLGQFAVGAPRIQHQLRVMAPPDLIHVQGGASQLAHVTAFSRLHRVPVVLTTQGEVVMDAQRIYQRSAFQRWSLALAARHAAALTTCSRWTRAQTVPVAPAFATSQVIPNGVAADDWAGLAPVPAQPVLAAWGRHVPQKGFRQLLAAFGILSHTLPGARLLLGGTGTETASLRAAAPGNVEFLGALDRAGVRDLLGRARVAVVPSLVEPFGIVALEVLAAGRTLVHSGAGGLPEAVGPHGLTADVRDPVGFATTLRAALDTPPADASAWLAEHSWERVAGEYEAVYREVLASRR